MLDTIRHVFDRILSPQTSLVFFFSSLTIIFFDRFINIEKIGQWAKPTLYVVLVITLFVLLIDIISKLWKIYADIAFKKDIVKKFSNLTKESADLIFACLYIRERRMREFSRDKHQYRMSMNELSTNRIIDDSNELCINKEVFEFLIYLRNTSPHKIPGFADYLKDRE